MPVPALDLHAQFREVEADVRKAIDRVLASQQFILGPEVAALESALAFHSGVGHAVGVSSGTDAILASLMALGIGPGDEVITTPFTFVATAAAIARLGARAVFVDIDPRTFALNAARIPHVLGPRTRAILPVHLFGQMGDLRTMQAIAKHRGVPILEDAAQAIGARRDGLGVGHGSKGATLSFFPSKNLGGMGDGGMVLTDDRDFAADLRRIRNQGQEPRYVSQVVGGNFRLDELQAAIIAAKLPRLDRWTRLRQAHAARYREAFQALQLPRAQLDVPFEANATRHIYNQFVIRTSRRNELRAFLDLRGIATSVYYPLPIHLHPAFRSWGYEAGDFPESEQAAGETLALPLYPELTAAAIGEVIAATVAFFASSS